MVLRGVTDTRRELKVSAGLASVDVARPNVNFIQRASVQQTTNFQPLLPLYMCSKQPLRAVIKLMDARYTLLCVTLLLIYSPSHFFFFFIFFTFLSFIYLSIYFHFFFFFRDEFKKDKTSLNNSINKIEH